MSRTANPIGSLPHPAGLQPGADGERSYGADHSR